MWLRLGVEMPRQTVNLLSVEDAVALHKGDFLFGFLAFFIGLGAGERAGIDNQLFFLSLSSPVRRFPRLACRSARSAGIAPFQCCHPESIITLIP